MVGNLPLSSTVFHAPSTTRHLARTVSRSNRGHCGSSSASTDSCRRLAWISSSVARRHSCSSVGVASDRVEQSTVMAPYDRLREFWPTRSRSLLMRQRIRLWIMLKIIWFQRWQTEVAWMSVEIGSCLNISMRSSVGSNDMYGNCELSLESPSLVNSMFKKMRRFKAGVNLIYFE
uniref:(northern house mosquito) hypothetical protein n=1 Tax=Culex pipiens TaxID=7175 RepID=A0A8D8FV99_CULPI